MLRKEDLDGVKSLIDNFHPRITSFEREILVPQVIGRLDYIVEIMTEFRKVASDKSVAVHIDAAVRAVVDPKLANTKLPEPAVGEHYLTAISRICEADYIKPIQELLKRNPPAEVLKDFESTSKFLNECTGFFQSIVSTKDTLFLYSFKTFLNLKNTATGEVLLGPPSELSLILMPFSTRLAEMVNVAETSIQSIRLWGEQIGLQKQRHVDIITNVSQVKSSEFQVAAAKWNLIVQVAVVILALVLIVGSYKANQYLEKKELEDSLQQTRLQLAAANEEIKSLNEQISQKNTPPATGTKNSAPSKKPQIKGPNSKNDKSIKQEGK